MSRRFAARGSLIVVEVALAVVLLVGAGLLTRSLSRLFAVAPGFDPNGLLTMVVIEPGTRYQSDTARMATYRQALDAVRAVPGVSTAAFTSQLPLSGDLDGFGYEFDGRPKSETATDGSALRYAVTPEYFSAMKIPLIRGRFLDARDIPGAESVLLSESFARRVFGNRDPIGQRIRIGPEVGGPRPWDVIVGVVGDVKQESLAASQTEAFYVSMGQWVWTDEVQSLVVRTSGDPASLASSVQRAIWSVDRNLPIQRVAAMRQLVAATGSNRRFALIVIESFAISALALAAVGLYGVISGGVDERLREIGIRTALGATAGNVVASVLRRGLVLAVAGAAIGIGGAVMATRLLVTLLFGVSNVDPPTYAAVAGLLLIVAMIASWLPARRASRVDPTIALRAE